MICYMKPGEPTDPRTILARLNEIDKCLLTGLKEDLEYIPVDFSIQNILPSNMACLSGKIVKDIGVCPCLTYSMVLWNDYEITFETTSHFATYNDKIIRELDHKEKYQVRPDMLADLYEYLISKHVKGIANITKKYYNERNYSLDCMQYQNYLLRRIVKAEKELNKKIITPGLEVVRN